MRDFSAKRWAPDGPRVHVYALPGPKVRELAEAFGPVLEAEPALRLVPAHRLHLTLGWLPVPAAEVSVTERQHLVRGLADAVATVHAMTIACGPVAVSRHGVRLEVAVDPALDELARITRRALREVFADRAAPEPEGWTPHVALAYGIKDTEPAVDVELGRALRDVDPGRAETTVDAVTVVTADTFAVDPWRWDGMLALPLRQSASCRRSG